MCSSLLRFSPPAYTVTLTQICVLMTNSHLLVGHTEMYGAIWWVYIIYIHIYAYCIDIYIYTYVYACNCMYIWWESDAKRSLASLVSGAHVPHPSESVPLERVAAAASKHRKQRDFARAKKAWANSFSGNYSFTKHRCPDQLSKRINISRFDVSWKFESDLRALHLHWRGYCRMPSLFFLSCAHLEAAIQKQTLQILGQLIRRLQKTMLM